MINLTQSTQQLLEPSTLIRLLTSLAIIILLISFIKNQRKIRAKYAQFTTLPTTFLLGNLLGNLEGLLSFGKKLNFHTFFANITLGITMIMHQEKKSLFYFRMGPFRHTLVAFNCRSAEALLTHPKNIDKAAEYEMLKPWLGNGLLTGQGSHWRTHRKLLTSAFHFQILKKFIPVMNRQLKTMLTYIEEEMHNSDEVVIEDVRPIITNCAMDIICETAMGIDTNAQNSWIKWKRSGGHFQARTVESQYVDALLSFLNIFLKRLLSPWLYLDFIFYLFPSGRQFYRNVNTMHSFTNNVILKRKEDLTKSFDDRFTVEESIARLSDSSDKKLAFLDLLLMYHLKNDSVFDLVSIREEVDTFMFGGHDTTSTTLQFAFLLIGSNLDKQRLIHKELDLIFGDDHERVINSDDIRKMAYLEQCIKETLRLYPPAAFFARTIVEPFNCDGYVVPKGTTMVVFTHGVHRDTQVYPKPERYIPERFSVDSPVHKHPFAFIPFSAGIRNCIGQRFAMLEMKIVLATILRKYQIKSITKPDNIELHISIISKSNTPIKVQFIKRQKSDGIET